VDPLGHTNKTACNQKKKVQTRLNNFISDF